MKKYISPSLVILPLIILLSPTLAHAYIDPGTTGIILQALIGGFVAALAFFSVMRHKIIMFLKKLFNKETDNKSDKL